MPIAFGAGVPARSSCAVIYWLVQFFDGVPVQVQLAGNVRHCAAATSPAYIPGKAFGIERVFCQKVEPFSFSLFHNDGKALVESRSPDRCVCRHKRDRELVEASCRTIRSEFGRRRCRLFF